MKKLLTVLSLLLITQTVNAQDCISSSYYGRSTNNKFVSLSADTVLGATGVDSTLFTLINYPKVLTVQTTLIKVAGRVDSTTVTLYGSLNGTYYVSLNSQTFSNASGALLFTVNSGIGSPYTHYKLKIACTNAAASSTGVWSSLIYAVKD